uniref:hypothetical protein n=2 Tax=Gammaproteobacteria TaxID=1236 RepID=UPI004048507D
KGTTASVSQIAKIAQQVVNRNVEWKYRDFANITGTIDTTGVVACLSLVPQGDLDTNRNGDHIRATSVLLNLSTSLRSTANCGYRIIVFQWNGDSTNSPPTMAAVLEQTNFNSMLSHDYRSRMAILHDSFFVLDQYNPTHQIQFKAKLPHQQIQFVGATTQHQHGVWIAMLSTLAAADDPPGFTYTSRLNYSDA